MGSSVIGSRMDIHSGGMDLKFPHHDNELAQSEAAMGCQQWVNHFWHAGHLKIDGLKMSKSLKNFLTIRSMLQKYTAREVRILFLLVPWNKEISFTESGLDEAKAKEQEINQFFLNTAVALRGKADLTASSQVLTAADTAMLAKLSESQAAVHSALCNDFSFPDAMQAISSLISYANKYPTICPIRNILHCVRSPRSSIE